MMEVSGETLIAIFVMATATIATRMAGMFVPLRWTQHGRIGAAFSALPIAVLTALIAPAVLTNSWKDALTAVIVAGLATRLPMSITVAISVAIITALRLGIT